MCEYCRCYGNNHDPQCPNYEEPEGSREIIKCAHCGEEIYEDDKNEYAPINGEFVHNDCLHDYCWENY